MFSTSTQIRPQTKRTKGNFGQGTSNCKISCFQTPIVCPCTTSEVELLNRIDGSPEGTESIQPVGSV